MSGLRAVLAVLALVALAAAGHASGTDAGVSLTETGPQPAEVSINWGDTVTFTNNDSVEHTVAIPGADYTSPAIPPGGAVGFRFLGRAGTYRFIQQGKRSFSGQVRVGLEGSVTLRPSSQVVPFGKSLVLSGRSTFPGTPVAISTRDAGAVGAFKPLLEVIAGDDGLYSARIRPKVGGRYQARVAAGRIASDTVAIEVRPRITMAIPRRTAPAGTAIVVTGRITPAGAANRAELMAYDPDRKRWISIQERPVPKTGRVEFRPKVEEGSTRLRITVAGASAKPGFADAVSRVVRVVGTKSK
jgi:plastocyanin